MEWNEQIFPFIKEHAIAITCALTGVICVGYGFINLSSPQQSNDPRFSSIQPASFKVKISQTLKEITIDIESVVQKPGVYKVSSDSRIKDALAAVRGCKLLTVSKWLKISIWHLH